MYIAAPIAPFRFCYVPLAKLKYNAFLYFVLPFFKNGRTLINHFSFAFLQKWFTFHSLYAIIKGQRKRTDALRAFFPFAFRLSLCGLHKAS
jgi:hypothetical protein